MKINSFRLHFSIFFIILLFFVIPPCFSLSPSSSQFTVWSFPFINLFYALIAFLIYFFFNDDSRFSLVFFPFLFSLALLLCASFFIKSLSIFFSDVFFQKTESSFLAESDIQILRPQNFSSWIFCILTFLFSAFYEEVIYRFFIPDSLILFASKKLSSKAVSFCCVGSEIITALLFAAAHIYLGLFSVLNALAAHVILRLIYKKYGLLIPVFLAHFCYNIISLMLL